MNTYLIEATDKHNQEISLEITADNIDNAKTICKEDGIKITQIVPKMGHHLCKYCHSITAGDEDDVLCDDCHELFGHDKYSEL